MSVGSVYRHVSPPPPFLVVASARVVVSEERRGKEREREREVGSGKKERMSLLLLLLLLSRERERHEGVRISSVLLFPKTRAFVAIHSSSELKQGKNAFAMTSRGVIGR